MATTTQRTLDDRLGGVERFVRALARNPEEWEPAHLYVLRDIEQELATVRSKAVYGMREHGYTDRQIAEALGITQQAVSKRWPGGGRFVGAAGRYRSTTTTTDRS